MAHNSHITRKTHSIIASTTPCGKKIIFDSHNHRKLWRKLHIKNCEMCLNAEEEVRKGSITKSFVK